MFLALLTVLGAFADFLSLGALLPFLAVLLAPDEVFSYPIVSWLANLLQLRTNDDILLLFSLLFVAMVSITAVIRLSLSYANTRISVAIGSELSSDTYRLMLGQPYDKYVLLDSSILISNISKSNMVATGLIQPILSILGATSIMIAIIIGLLVVDPVITLVISIIIGGCYAGFSRFTKHLIEINGRTISDGTTHRIKVVHEGFGGFRDIVLSGTQDLYAETYRRVDLSLRWAHGMNTIIGMSPRVVMEAIGAITLVAVAYVLGQGPDGVTPMLPVLGALAYGAQRLIPAFQQIYNSRTTLMGAQAQVVDALELLERLKLGDQDEKGEPRPTPLDFAQTVSMIDVGFRYTAESPWVLDRVNLEIRKGDCVGIVGPTGEGKSTLLDVLMGLLPPTSGALIVDGQPVEGRTRLAWQESIAHVPQAVFLANVSLAENIAFGVHLDDINWGLLDQVVEMAQLASLVSDSPDGYDSKVGERGIRLSGGQRQRIGIARALYLRRDVLVLDEATSALDDKTEDLVQQALNSLDDDVTMIWVSHRASTLSICNRIVSLEHGSIQEISSIDDAQEHGLLGPESTSICD